MKTSVTILIIFFSILFLGCKKEVSENGTFLIKVVYNGQPLPNATVYMKSGAVSNPGIPLGQYDRTANASAAGLAIFEDISPNSYYLYATGNVNSVPVTGDLAVTYAYTSASARREFKLATQ